MDLIRGWERCYAPDVTGGLRLRKAALYRRIEVEEGVGDTREGEVRTGMWDRVEIEPSSLPSLDLPMNVSISSEVDDLEIQVEGLRPGESREVLHDLRVNDSTLDSPFLLCLSREPLTADEWKLRRTALPKSYDAWTITGDLDSLRFEVEWGIKRWLALQGITEHTIHTYRGWVEYSYETRPSPLDPNDALVEALQIRRWYRKSRKYIQQQEYRLAWHITSPQLERFPDEMDIELTRTGLNLFVPWSPPG